jgi:hypothetical protein
LVGVVLADDFDGEAFDEIAGAVLLSLIDNPHPALENFADDVVAELVLNGEQRHDLMVIELDLKSSRHPKKPEKIVIFCLQELHEPI